MGMPRRLSNSSHCTPKRGPYRPGLGADLHRHPVRLDIGAAAAYWDAPAPMTGPVEVNGYLELNRIDAPDDFPSTIGIIRRVRMQWRRYRHLGGGDWR